MFPNVHGFHWSAGHILFVSVFLSVMAIVLTMVALAAFRTWRTWRAGRVEKIRWLSDFHDLPPQDRPCRHELTGEFRKRHCERGFECYNCETHAALVARNAPETEAGQETEESPMGLCFPSDRLYHRGHTWVKPDADGTYVIGLDDFATRLVGRPEKVELPAPGRRLEANGTGWKMMRNGVEVRILSPIDGEVIETGGPDREFYLRVKSAEKPETAHLLRGVEVRPWIMREVERLQLLLSPGSTGLSLADGGVLAGDVPAMAPQADWDMVWGKLFLEP